MAENAAGFLQDAIPEGKQAVTGYCRTSRTRLLPFFPK
jgi:hypothetical protein